MYAISLKNTGIFGFPISIQTFIFELLKFQIIVWCFIFINMMKTKLFYLVCSCNSHLIINILSDKSQISSTNENFLKSRIFFNFNKFLQKRIIRKVSFQKFQFSLFEHILVFASVLIVCLLTI